MNNLEKLAKGLTIAKQDTLDWKVETFEGLIVLGPAEEINIPCQTKIDLIESGWIYCNEYQGWCLYL